MIRPIAVASLALAVSAEFLARGHALGHALRADRRQELRLPALFGDGMVLQRNEPIVVWGWATPRTQVSVTLHTHTGAATADAAGRWRATLPAERAGGPFAMVVRSAGERVDVHDVLVGDVWLASGQSNMEFTVAQGNDAQHEISAANDSSIRQFKVPNSWADSASDEVLGGPWTPADAQHAGAFTAVGYFFARALRSSEHVPIGVINATWSGSNIETWLSRGASRLSDSAWSAIQAGEANFQSAVRDSLRMKLGALPTTDSGLVAGAAPWANPSLDDAAWSTIRVPAYWESQGYAGMDGVAWYRVSFVLDDAERQRADRGATLSLAAVDDDDITWINGIEIGRTAGYDAHRAYRVPSGALRAGRNVLVVRVTDGGGGGGINGAVSLALDGGAPRALDGEWKFKVGAVTFHADAQHTNKIPTISYNQMIHPLLPFAIKGVIWYQGESNANNVAQAAAYREQFATLIASWRRDLRTGGNSLPFLWVQLPNFGPVDSVPPADAAWATQRESMSAALSMPNTGQAITIDVGDATNLHPRDKQDVGARLALVARRIAYRELVVASGPTYRAHSVRGDTVVVEFANAGRELVSRSNDGRVGGFAIAGRDKHFVWANARIVGSRVYVWSEHVAAPVAVRYAWANNPARANLFNGDQLPAVPFRTDRW